MDASVSPATPSSDYEVMPRLPASGDGVLFRDTMQSIFGSQLRKIPELEALVVPALEEIIDGPRASFEAMSRLVRWVGASDVREWVKALVLSADSPERQYRVASRDPANAFDQPASSVDEHIQRVQRVEGVHRSAHVAAVDRLGVLHEFAAPIQGLAPELTGITILHLSDIHFCVGRPSRVAAVEALTDHLRQRGIVPDVVVISGDIITRRAEDFDAAAERALQRIPFNLARVYVPGNHDYYNQSIEVVRNKMARSGFGELTNRTLRLQIEGVPLTLAGVDDHLEGRPRAPREFEAVDGGANVLLLHNLDALQRHFPASIDLVLSGHTHAGEVQLGKFHGGHVMRLFGYLDILNRHVRGWRSLTDRTLSYISPGHAGHYLRFGTDRPGGTLLRLTRA